MGPMSATTLRSFSIRARLDKTEREAELAANEADVTTTHSNLTEPRTTTAPRTHLPLNIAKARKKSSLAKGRRAAAHCALHKAAQSDESGNGLGSLPGGSECLSGCEDNCDGCDVCDEDEESDEEGSNSDEENSDLDRHDSESRGSAHVTSPDTSTYVPHPAHTRVPRGKPENRFKNLSAAHRAGLLRAQAADNHHCVTPFDHHRFENFDAFLDALSEYGARNYVAFRTRSSHSTEAENVKIGREPLTVDSADEMYNMQMWCVHGTTQPPRDEQDQRVQLNTRYTGCNARVTGTLTWDGEKKKHYVRVTNEIAVHNHAVSKDVFTSYFTTGRIQDDVMFERIAWAHGVGGDPRLLRDEVARETGLPYSQSQMNNLVNYWMGGPGVSESVHSLIESFASFEGARCLIIKDPDGKLAGLAWQSSAQRALARRWGDSFVLDWTHNTNNMDFSLGALLVTTANGKGASVLDVLCVSQSNAMMKLVFEFFLEHNPETKEKLKSVVIDKDYGEWKTAESVFGTAIVLCLFHVLKWFKHVIRKPQYELGTITEDVMSHLRGMVYATSEKAFEAQKIMLRQLLNPDEVEGHQAFLDYMEAYWYSCKDMWCTAFRGKVFTACNTTSNRIESFWNQLKAALGSRRRLDLCIETIFQHATTILRREEALLRDYIAKTPVYENADDKLRSTLTELSRYAAHKVQTQWTKYIARRPQYRVLPSETSEGARSPLHTLQSFGRHEVDFQVDSKRWTCSCRFYSSSHLPCRHLMFVALDVLQYPEYPVAAVHTRWRMSEAIGILPILSKNIKELETLRTRLLFGVEKSSQTNDGSNSASSEPSPNLKVRSLHAITHVQLRKHEISDSRVLSNLQKLGACNQVIDPLVEFAMGLSTPMFKSFMNELGSSMSELLVKYGDQRMSESTTTTTVMSDLGSENPVGAHTANTTFVEVDVGEWRACRASDDDDDAQIDVDIDEDYDEQNDNQVEVAGNSLLLLFGYPSPFEPSDIEDAAALGVPAQRAESDNTHPLPSFFVEPDGFSAPFELPVQHPRVSTILQQAFENGVTTSAIQRVSGASNILTADSVDILLCDTDDDANPSSLRDVGDSVKVADRGGLFTAVMDRQSSGQKLFTLSGGHRGKRRISQQQSSSTGRPLATVSQGGRKCPINIFQLIVVVRFSCCDQASRAQDCFPKEMQANVVQNRKATARLESYAPKQRGDSNAVIPFDVCTILQNAVDAQREIDGAHPFILHVEEDGAAVWNPQYVARIGQLRDYPESLLAAVREFYALSRIISDWKADKAWCLGAWKVPIRAQAVPFLQDHANAVEGVNGALDTTRMRAAIVETLDTLVLATQLSLVEGRNGMQIALTEIVGRIAFTAKLNDTVVNFALHVLAARHTDVVIVDSLNIAGRRHLPNAKFVDSRIVIFPLHDGGDHWSVLLVCQDAGSVVVRGFDPMPSGEGTHIKQRWNEGCLPLLQSWLLRDGDADAYDLTTASIEFLKRPTQPDWTCCGLLCVAQAAAYIDNYERQFQLTSKPSAFAVKVMRVRLMWLLLCSTATTVDEVEAARASEYKTIYARYTDASGREDGKESPHLKRSSAKKKARIK